MQSRTIPLMSRHEPLLVKNTAFRMEQMKGASTDAWQEIARGADEARKTMQVAFDKARAKFDDI